MYKALIDYCAFPAGTLEAAATTSKHAALFGHGGGRGLMYADYLAYSLLSPADWAAAADNAQWNVQTDEIFSHIVVQKKMPECGQGPLDDVSIVAVAARIGIFVALSRVLCAGFLLIDLSVVSEIELTEHVQSGGMAHAFFSNACARVLVRSTVNDLFDKAIKTVKDSSPQGDFPSFSVNRGILPADQRKRQDTVFKQTFKHIGTEPDKYPLLRVSTRGVGSRLQILKVSFL